MKRVLVTGGAGYVGSGLLRTLLNTGFQVDCVDILKFGGDSPLDIWTHPGFAFHKIDITDYPAVDRVLQQADYHAVVHLAAIVGDPACGREPELARRVNLDASLHLIDSCQAAGIPRFIFASTCSNYGKMSDPDLYLDEDSPLAPVSLYAELKVEFEHYLLDSIPRQETFAPTALRFSTVYGLSPRMRFDLTVNEFTKDLASGRVLEIFGEQFWRPYCHVGDFSRAIQAVLEAPPEKVAHDVFNIGDTAENYTKKMIATELLRQIPTAQIEYVYKEDDPRDYRVSFEKAKNVLGFNISKTVPQGIAEIKEVITQGIIADPEEQKYYNIPHQRPA